MPGSIAQLVLATMFVLAYLVIQVQARPYREKAQSYLALVVTVSIFVVLFICNLYKWDALVALFTAQSAQFGLLDFAPLRGFVIEPAALTALITAAIFATLAFALVLMFKEVAEERWLERARRLGAKARRLRYVHNDGDVSLAPLEPRRYHLFLSHVWGSGQDQMRVVKQRLLEMLPDAQVFLDVDDLQEGRGAEYVDRCEATLVFCSDGYFFSPNCMRELMRALQLGKPIIALLEPDRKHGGLGSEQVRRQLWEAEGLYASWGLEAEMIDWGFERPDPDALHASLFAEPIEWNRIGAFQDLTMRLIAERLLPPGHPPTYLSGEVTRQKLPRVPPPRGGRRRHLYVSRYNEGARELVDEVHTCCTPPHFATNTAPPCPPARPPTITNMLSSEFSAGTRATSSPSIFITHNVPKVDPPMAQVEAFLRERGVLPEGELEESSTPWSSGLRQDSRLGVPSPRYSGGMHSGKWGGKSSGKSSGKHQAAMSQQSGTQILRRLRMLGFPTRRAEKTSGGGGTRDVGAAAAEASDPPPSGVALPHAPPSVGTSAIGTPSRPPLEPIRSVASESRLHHALALAAFRARRDRRSWGSALAEAVWGPRRNSGRRTSGLKVVSGAPPGRLPSSPPPSPPSPTSPTSPTSPPSPARPTFVTAGSRGSLHSVPSTSARSNRSASAGTPLSIKSARSLKSCFSPSGYDGGHFPLAYNSSISCHSTPSSVGNPALPIEHCGTLWHAGTRSSLRRKSRP
jgi:hypothetical protein